jgi:competence protein ComEA
LDGTDGWRVIDTEEPAAQRAAPGGGSPEHDSGRVSRAAIAAAAAIGFSLLALVILVSLPAGAATVESNVGRFDPRAQPGGSTGTSGLGRPSPVLGQDIPERVVVDVQGAVVTPGVHELRGESRVADAIDAAGGYSALVDVAAASRSLNLAARLTDGQQIHVPVLGEAAAATPAPPLAPGTSGAGGLVDLNHASADELDTLPGVGPVTAAKIIDARAEAAFASVDELQSRGIVGPSTFEKLRELVTVTP